SDSAGPGDHHGVGDRPRARTTEPLKENAAMAQLILPATQQADLLVTNTDSRGNPAPVHDAAWTSSDVALLTITVDATDGNKAVVKAGGATAAAPGAYPAAGDLGEGVVPIIATMDVVLNPGQAVVSSITAGTPVEQP